MMEKGVVTSIVFETANGHKVEVTRAQMENVRKQLWADDKLDVIHTSQFQQKQSIENKENYSADIDYFDDSFDDLYDELVVDDTSEQNDNSRKRALDANSENYNYKKKKIY